MCTCEYVPYICSACISVPCMHACTNALVPAAVELGAVVLAVPAAACIAAPVGAFPPQPSAAVLQCVLALTPPPAQTASH